MSYDLLRIVASASLGNAPTGADATFPQWTGPDPTIVHVQAILYSSLAASLLAAFIAMLCKQWLNRYARVDMHESVIDRSRHRQRKMNGVDNWHFNLVMESAPLVLQAALLLLSYALSDYLFSINKVVASVFIGITGFTLGFYLLVVSAAGVSYSCPFQTPLSQIARSLILFDNQHKRYLKRTRKWFKLFFSEKKKRSRPRSGSLGRPGTPDGSGSSDHAEAPMANQPGQPPPLFNTFGYIAVPMANQLPLPLFNRDTDWAGYMLDSQCIAWMFKMSMDTDAVMAILRFIPEVVWYAGIYTPPLERLYDTLVECFDRSSGYPIVIPKLKDKAYLAAKAFLHLTIQRKCIGDERDADAFKSISNRHLPAGPQSYEGDSDLTSTLGIIDCVFGGSAPMDWQHFSFTATHHAWMGHILLYRAWDALGSLQPLPDDINEFICHSFRSEPSLRSPIIADCWFIISLILEIPLHVDDLSAINKRHVDVQCSFHDLMLTLDFKL
jgi:hypothetical protein